MTFIFLNLVNLLIKIRKVICISNLVVHINFYTNWVILWYYWYIVDSIRFIVKLSFRSIFIVSHAFAFFVNFSTKVKKGGKSIINLCQMILNEKIPKWSKYKRSNYINRIMNSCYCQHIDHVHYWNDTYCTYWLSPQGP